MEMAIARSMAGSTVRAPPTVDTYTSAPEVSAPMRAWTTARIMATRAWSTPEVVRRGDPPEEGATSD